MGRRYYCDYCDKLFIDDIEARKKHLNSVHHQKMRKIHYDSFRDLSVILDEESRKTPCNRFRHSGYCQFESSCKYTHYRQEELWQMKETILYEQQKKIQKPSAVPDVPLPEEWIAKYLKNQDERKENVAKVFWTYPQQLQNRFDLPPSMKKFQPEYFQDADFPEWGKSSK